MLHAHKAKIFDTTMNPKPINKSLYKKVKKEIFSKYPENSAYRSGLLVKTYKERGGKYIGNKSKSSLNRWFQEDWKNQRGGIGYSKTGDVYRPTKKVSKKTPKTFKELGKTRIRKAIEEKKKTGRVQKF